MHETCVKTYPARHAHTLHHRKVITHTHDVASVIYPVRPHKTFALSFRLFTVVIVRTLDTNVIETNRISIRIKINIFRVERNNSSPFNISIAIKCSMRQDKGKTEMNVKFCARSAYVPTI